jgi:hypothetical protein
LCCGASLRQYQAYPGGSTDCEDRAQWMAGEASGAARHSAPGANGST